MGRKWGEDGDGGEAFEVRGRVGGMRSRKGREERWAAKRESVWNRERRNGEERVLGRIEMR